jgi:Xaa-Pro aminopeptidase
MDKYEVELRKAKGLPPIQPRREFENRTKRLKELMNGQGFNALLVYGAPRVAGWMRYLANYIHPFAPSESYLMFPIEGNPILLVDFPWFIDHARKMSWIKDVRLFPRYQYNDLVEFFKNIFAKNRLEKAEIGICSAHMPALHYLALRQALPNAVFKDATDLLFDVITNKSNYDHKMMRQTAKIADSGMKVMLDTCKEGRREYEIALAGEAEMCAEGAEYGSGVTARTWFHIGSSCISPLGNTRPYSYTARKLEKGDMFFIDLGVCYKGYYIDFCRTVSIGQPTLRQKELFETVSNMHEKMFESLRPGITGSEMWEIGYNIAKERGYTKYPLNVWFGHGIGIEVNEPPWLDKGETRIIKENTFVNIEPGIFVPNVGGVAIEDTTFVTKKGGEFVTDCDRELHIG